LLSGVIFVWNGALWSSSKLPHIDVVVSGINQVTGYEDCHPEG